MPTSIGKGWFPDLTPSVTVLDVVVAPPRRAVVVLASLWYDRTYCATCALVAHGEGHFSGGETMHFNRKRGRAFRCLRCDCTYYDPE